MGTYGVPYKGSKNKIAEWVVSNLPTAQNFYDLFAGGCAITHCALLSGKYDDYFANDIWTTPKLFKDAIDGKYKNETRWISREDFFRLRLTDPYVQFCWSFGNGGCSYIYGKPIEPYKKACHYAIVFDDWKDFEKLCPEVFEAAENALEGIKDIHERRIRFGPAIVEELKRLNDWSVVEGNILYNSCHSKKNWKELRHNCNYIPGRSLQSLERLQSLESLERLQRLESLESLERLQRLESLESLERLQSLQSLESLQSLQSLESLESLSISQGDYRNVKIKPDSVIYCDIPYRNTSSYDFESRNKNKNSFDYDAFYDWCARQTELVVVSEYQMPKDDFICIGKKIKTVSLCGGSANRATECLFIPKHQKELYEQIKLKNLFS